MRIGILGVGKVASKVLAQTSHGLVEIFPDTTCEVIGDILAVPEYAFDKKRGQYNSTITLNDVQSFAAHRMDLNRGKRRVDFTLAPKTRFYGEATDSGAFEMRILKESIHELGHTLGLVHCPKSYCVMYFSNSIFELDKKQSLFCDQCYLNASIAITKLGQQT